MVVAVVVDNEDEVADDGECDRFNESNKKCRTTHMPPDLDL